MSLASALSFLNNNSKKSAATSSSNQHQSSSTSSTTTKPLHIAIEGCSHGELDKIYDECASHEQQEGTKIDFLICCGDFQSIRSGEQLQKQDLESIHIPKRFLSVGDFPKYFSGEKKAPILTIVIGGNHEASNFLFEQYYGGFLCENIFYLGHSGVINVGGLRIAGLSGIFKVHDFQRLYPVPPYNGDEGKIRGAYHVRKFELEKLKMLRQDNQQQQKNKNPIDIFISHDWPVGVTDFGDTDDLLRKKPYFKEDIEKRELGNPHTMELLKLLQPRYWFAAHLHVRFKALIHHEKSHTEFLALDKCVRHTNEFLQFMNILPSSSSSSSQMPQRDPFTNQLYIYHDPDWLEIIRKTHVNIPLAVNAGTPSSAITVDWLIKSYLPLRNRMVMDPVSMKERRERREAEEQETRGNANREQDVEEEKPIRASTTMELLKEMGLVVLEDDDQNRNKQQRQTTFAVSNGNSTSGMTAKGSVESTASGNNDDLLAWGEDV